MQSTKLSVGLMTVVALVAFGTGKCAVAQQEKVLHNFGVNHSDGLAPRSVLIFDSAGNLYGTTGTGGSPSSFGAVFELMPTGGVWTEKILHVFAKNDGHYPLAGLVSDSSGNLYGTTIEGGAYGFGNFKGGTVFELHPTGGGRWTEKILHSFGSGSDGYNPWDSLILDSAGNLYGTTAQGGDLNCDAPFGCGTVFELTPSTSGNWTEKILYNFIDNGSDGKVPYAGLIFDGIGNLYGMTAYGGTGVCSSVTPTGCGTVFELAHQSNGGWEEKVLYSFNRNGIDGFSPYASLTIDAFGNLYGTTVYGGPNSCGIVFELTSLAGGWAEKVLHNFADNGVDGCFPYSTLILDASGNLYGTASDGGAANDSSYDSGVVFELKLAGGGTWAEKVLHSFGSGTDGGYALAGLVFDPSGSLYGTTQNGGPNGTGTLYEIKP